MPWGWAEVVGEQGAREFPPCLVQDVQRLSAEPHVQLENATLWSSCIEIMNERPWDLTPALLPVMPSLFQRRW